VNDVMIGGKRGRDHKVFAYSIRWAFTLWTAFASPHTFEVEAAAMESHT